MKVHELITMLQKYDLQAEVIGTWEGEVWDIDVYRAADGRIMVDVDDNSYKAQWQKTECVICYQYHWHYFEGEKP